MTFPAFVFGLVLATLYGAVFHLWKGGGFSKLLLFQALSWLGFWAGHFLGAVTGIHFITAGPLNAGFGTLGSVLFLFLGEWLSRIEITRK